ncbi:hypothetical protein COT50_04175 [candidate division WWE3 bacterium CG08_land_8_20_14_0_20_41_10]|uniref:N-acetyltransferase domain-containing protein n=1 Tax=candidate division WWE3 bacterium CG08_land_8_20_14_0_20_41_10 TaxID=1975085 RepID=A0A2H0XAS6_UNCKA|nr:MAG: hypothetical protein COT50_04175 [candidate division WWE3 bacterium CG08_land_8_20_14_0_20_41_10]
MNNIAYKRATLDDLTTLYDLGLEFEHFNKVSSTRPHEHFSGDWENYIAKETKESLKKRGSYVFLAFVDATPAGYISARLCKGCYAFIIEELYVRPEYSRLGIGGKLLELAIKQGKKLDHDIKVEVFDWNQNAKDYYLKKGFFVESLVLKLLGT